MAQLTTSLTTISARLGITEADAALIFCYNRQWCGKLGVRRMYALLEQIVDRFGLDDREIEKTYGEQLVERGVLTPAEARFFSEGEIINAAPQKAIDTTATRAA